MADKKRKGLMEVLAEYRSEQEAKRKGVSKKGASALGAAAARGKKETRPSSTTHRKPPTAPPPVAKKTAPKTSTPKKEERVGQPASYNLVKPTKMAPRKKRPGTGRTGEAAAKAANRTSAPKKKPMTAAERRKMRLRARRGR